MLHYIHAVDILTYYMLELCVTLECLKGSIGTGLPIVRYGFNSLYMLVAGIHYGFCQTVVSYWAIDAVYLITVLVPMSISGC